MAILAFLAKIKSILLLLPKIKLLVTAGSMAVSIAAYTTIWGFWFAIGFVVLLLVHELGHVIAAAARGDPGVGTDVHPVPGRRGRLALTGRQRARRGARRARRPDPGHHRLGRLHRHLAVTGHDYWRALGYTGFFLNLFNLLPVVPLDGGRAMAAMSPWMWFAGFFGDRRAWPSSSPTRSSS